MCCEPNIKYKREPRGENSPKLGRRQALRASLAHVAIQHSYGSAALCSQRNTHTKGGSSWLPTS